MTRSRFIGIAALVIGVGAMAAIGFLHHLSSQPAHTGEADEICFEGLPCVRGPNSRAASKTWKKVPDDQLPAWLRGRPQPQKPVDASTVLTTKPQSRD